MVTDGQGQVVSRHDYLPFGEEIPAGNGGRTAQWGAADGVTQKFTGQERDQETDLDFFHARYFSAAQHRVLSRDPMNAGVDLFNPQSWNAYACVNNSPLSNTDPSGLGSMGVIFNPFRSEPNSSVNSGGGSGRSGGGFTFWQSSNTPPAVSTIGPANRLAPNTAQLPQKNGFLDKLKQQVCAAIPNARTITVDLGIGGMGSVHGAVQATLDYRTGKTSFAAQGGFQTVWNGVVSANASMGFVYGSSNTNRSISYSGGAVVSGYYQKSGSAREAGVGIGWGWLGKLNGGVTVSESTEPVGNVPGLVLPSDTLFLFAKQACAW